LAVNNYNFQPHKGLAKGECVHGLRSWNHERQGNGKAKRRRSRGCV